MQPKSSSRGPGPVALKGTARAHQRPVDEDPSQCCAPSPKSQPPGREALVADPSLRRLQPMYRQRSPIGLKRPRACVCRWIQKSCAHPLPNSHSAVVRTASDNGRCRRSSTLARSSSSSGPDRRRSLIQRDRARVTQFDLCTASAGVCYDSAVLSDTSST